MRYQLIDRFRGALLGAFIGEVLALNHAKKSTDRIWWQEIIVSSAQSLIELGKFDIKDWGDRVQKQLHNRDPSNSILTAAIIATLPVTFFFHENTVKLRNNLLESLELWGSEPEIRDAVLAVSYVIALSLNEKLFWETLIPQTVDFIGDASANLPQKLLQIDRSISSVARRPDIIEAELCQQLTPITATEFAFYYFVSCPEDFRLCMLRANREPCLGVRIISGILSGAYNSTSGIPVNWQIGQSNLKIAPSSFSNCSQMLKLADALIAVWSGVYKLALHSNTNKDKLTIAAPSVIRYR